MKLIKLIATPLTIVSSIIVILSGVWMFFFSKGPALENIHSYIGFVFLIAIILHSLVNWGPLARATKSKATYIITLVAVIVCLGFVFGGKRSGGGAVPVGALIHKLEDARLEDLSRVFNVDSAIVMSSMNQDGILVSDTNLVLKDIANSNGKQGKDLIKYFLIRGRQ